MLEHTNGQRLVTVVPVSPGIWDAVWYDDWHSYGDLSPEDIGKDAEEQLGISLVVVDHWDGNGRCGVRVHRQGVTMNPVDASLPNGTKAQLPIAQFRRVWQVWLALAPIAASRGEGILVETDHDPWSIAIMTAYAPQWEGVRVICLPDGSAVWCSEQSAPDLIGVDFTAPPPPAPWEKEGFENRCRRSRLATLRARLIALLAKRGEKYEAVDQALTALGVLVLWEATGVSPTEEPVMELERLWPVE